MNPTHPTTTERRARPRGCNPNACRQGHKACPAPQACQLPEEQPGTPMEYTGLVLGVLGVVVLLGLALVSCAGA